MPFEKRVPLPGSDRKILAGATKTSAVAKDEIIHVTVVLRHRNEQSIAMGPGGTAYRNREEYSTIHGAAPIDMEVVESFAHESGLTVSERHPHSRSVVLSGTADAMQKAFGSELAHYSVPHLGITYRGRTGTIMLPQELSPMVLAVLGLDNRPAAKPHFRRRTAAAQNGAFTPIQLGQLYNFPTGVNGTGETIAIIELGGGYKASDLHTYFHQLGIKGPRVTAVSVDGGHNTPGGDADGEVMLDIEVAGAVAPGAHIVVYFAPNTDQGFHDAIAAASHDTARHPSIISISWGQSEDDWTDQARNAMNAAMQDAAAMGITVTVAAGDNGATDGAQDNQLHVDFPASSPFVLACGGTKLVAAGSNISDEQVWNELSSNEGATGGGVSRIFALPQYQNSAGVPKHPETGATGRGVPDVAGDADPATGYMVRVDGQNTVIGGTSAVAPLWAGLAALINQQLGKPIGFMNPLIYQLSPDAFRDIVSGNNNGYKAGKNWDACTGLGSPNGSELVKALQGRSASAKST